MKKIIHKDYCSRCKTKEGPLMSCSQVVTSSTIHQYKRCRKCNAAMQKEYYHSLTPAKQKEYSKRSNAWNAQQAKSRSK